MGGRRDRPLNFPYELCFAPERKASEDRVRCVTTCFHEEQTAAPAPTLKEEILRRVLWK